MGFAPLREVSELDDEGWRVDEKVLAAEGGQCRVPSASGEGECQVGLMLSGSLPFSLLPVFSLPAPL